MYNFVSRNVVQTILGIVVKSLGGDSSSTRQYLSIIATVADNRRRDFRTLRSS